MLERHVVTSAENVYIQRRLAINADSIKIKSKGVGGGGGGVPQVANCAGEGRSQEGRHHHPFL